MTLPRFIVLYPNNTQVIQIQGLSDVTNGMYLNSASVTATLLDQRDQVDPILQNIVLGYVSGSTGNYLGTVPATFSPAAFIGNELNGYTLQITAIQSGVQALFSIPAVIKPRAT